MTGALIATGLLGFSSVGLASSDLASPALVSSDQAQAAPSEQDRVDCSSVVAPDPSSPDEWLERNLWASHCYAFQARAVIIDAIGVRTLALSHRLQDGVRQQVVQNLDGPSVSVERHAQAARPAWLNTDDISSNAVGVDGDSSYTAVWAEHLARYYRIESEAESRVAGRDTIELDFYPLDNDRYTHEWSIDRSTGLLLKHVLKSATGEVLETFQVTQLQEPQRYDGDIRIEAMDAIPSYDWQANWLPDGFVEQPAVSATSQRAQQRSYSDGMTTISVFAEPVEEGSGLAPGVRQLGVSGVAVKRVTTGDQHWQLLAIGEVPLTTLERVLDAVQPTDGDDPVANAEL
ncbi:MucB/RseB C-terminal domain-containing protein [Halomonas dongshanensis]|uniref:MucB/RseB C-terminal domain-containing protein n=1 Tax=Halomonas dongshanensis TaxID=2890835 RepID=A0ABT2EEU8_9GAMM|nr:MucB/RseB C-terminal domain-containing protein [Halomonas dongshanensis]MCS2610101.1 MucB/RseB C-terminal domain-containing protein [Halomonas dongshanensis]